MYKNTFAVLVILLMMATNVAWGDVPAPLTESLAAARNSSPQVLFIFPMPSPLTATASSEPANIYWQVDAFVRGEPFSQGFPHLKTLSPLIVGKK